MEHEWVEGGVNNSTNYFVTQETMYIHHEKEDALMRKSFHRKRAHHQRKIQKII